VSKINLTPPPVTHSDLTAELRSLRKGSGLTVWKLSQAPELKALAASQLGLPQDSLPLSQVQAYLVHELEALGEGIEARATRNAFALGQGGSPGNLMERRIRFSTTVGRHPDTIEGYENRGIEELASRLNNAHLQACQVSREAASLSDSGNEQLLNAARNMVTQGLADLYGLGTHAAEIHRCFSRGHKPYLDANVEWLLLPSRRGDGWYTYQLRYTFRSQRGYYRIGIVASAYDAEVLMASGVVDDVIKLNADHYEDEIDKVVEGCCFIIHDSEQRTQQPILFRRLDEPAQRQLVEPLWQLSSENCHIIQAEVPPSKGQAEALYECRWSFDLPVNGERYAYWSAPGLMYLNNITVDFSRFPQRSKWRFLLQPSLVSSVFPGGVELADSDHYTLPASSWIMQGHGICLIWQPAAPDVITE